MPRDEFNIEVKRRLAQRAGYQCSMCNRITVGPSEEGVDKVNSTGVAAHICAASPGGRRYDATQTQEERGSIENGIWLCSLHGDLIDGDEITYTVQYLKSAKANHEAKIKFNQQGFNVEKGMITGIELSNFGRITQAVNLTFSERNIILGNNGVGKTLICEMITALENKDFLWRWKKKRKANMSNSYCHVGYFKNEEIKLTICISDKGEVSYWLDDVEVPFLESPIKVFYINEEFYHFKNRLKRESEEREETDLTDDDYDDEDIVYCIAKYFGLEKKQFLTVIKSMSRAKKFFINDIKVDDSETELLVKYLGNRGGDFHSFGSFSGGEKQRILLEIALKLAEFYAKFKPTILIIENSSLGTMDVTGLNRLLDIIGKEAFDFQFFFTSIWAKEKFTVPGYTTWKLKLIDKIIVAENVSF